MSEGNPSIGKEVEESSKSEIKRIPKGWEWKTLGEVAQFINGRAFKPEEWEEKGKLIIRIQDLTKRVRDPHYSTREYENKYLVQNGDLLVSWSATLDASLWNGNEGWLNQHIFKVSEKKNILDRTFLFYLLRKNIDSMKSQTHGSTMKHITKKRFLSIRIPLPPLPVQKKIVAILDKADRTRRLHQQINGYLDEFLKSVFIEMFGDPVKNPKGWEVKKLGLVGSLKRGKSKHRPRNAPELLGGPYPLIQTGDVANSNGYIRNFNQTYSEIGLQQSQMWPAGILCITIAANIAKTGILTFDACFPDSVVGFAPSIEITTEYVRCWMSFLQKIIEKKAPESAQKNINLEILSNLEIPLPSLPLQEKFALIVENVEQFRQQHQQSSQETEDLFNALMQKAFRGELT